MFSYVQGFSREGRMQLPVTEDPMLCCCHGHSAATAGTGFNLSLNLYVLKLPQKRLHYISNQHVCIPRVGSEVQIYFSNERLALHVSCSSTSVCH